MDEAVSVDEALARAAAALSAHPAGALAQADLVLEAVPGHPRALLIRGGALARLGQGAAARAILEPLAASQPRAASVQHELGALLAHQGAVEPAIAALRRAVALKPALPQAWRLLGDQLALTGQQEAAEAAYAAHLRHAASDPALIAAGDALVRGDLADAEARLRRHLAAAPTDLAALRMLAEVATRLGRYGPADALLRACLDLSPGFTTARYQLAVVLYRQNQAVDALPEIERAAGEQPGDPNFRLLLAACLASTGQYARAIDLYAALLAFAPDLPRLLLGHGHALRTAGRRADAIAAYRRVIAVAPANGEAWWSLANLKIGALGPADLATMQALTTQADLAEDDRIQLGYAIGRVLDEQDRPDAAFAAYAEAARRRRAAIPYDADATTRQIDRTIALFTPEFFAARRGCGNPDPSPIFILGLPRSGSTLIEQMLASHSAVEGTMELPELITVARRLGSAAAYPQLLQTVPPERFAQIGAEYLARASRYRQTGKPRFIDKLPNNWVHVGLIQLILPNATIIDARRDPMAACFSCFTQYFARGQNYSYDLTELGRYTRDYVRLMDHFDQVLPGFVQCVRYERLVERTESELRQLLANSGLGFEPACLEFHRNDRPVRTASSEQVRRPIYRDGIGHWRRFAPQLAALRVALGSASESD